MTGGKNEYRNTCRWKVLIILMVGLLFGAMYLIRGNQISHIYLVMPFITNKGILRNRSSSSEFTWNNNSLLEDNLTLVTANLNSSGEFTWNNDSLLQDNLTVVTAYFNLGSFQKGGGKFTPELYRQWMTIFSAIDSPLVVYVDKDSDMEYFRKIRSLLPKNLTKIIKVERNETWAFGLEKRIAEIFKFPGYPKHHPNTVVPGYSMAMHAKYEVVQKTIRENPFHTKYFCWLDIGLFRDMTSGNAIQHPENPGYHRFRLELPINFQKNSVAYTEVSRRNGGVTPKQIVYNNLVWLCGCYFVGEGSVLYRWTQEYQNATMMMISQNLMSTDQQVIYFMFNTMKPKTKIQTYRGDGRFNEWFHLGYVSRKLS